MTREHTGPATDRWRGALICLVVVLCPVAYSFRLTSFLHAKEAVLCLGLCAVAAVVVVRGRLSVAGCTAFLPLWVFLGLAAVLHLGVFPARVPAAVIAEIARYGALLIAAAFAYDLLREGPWRDRIVNALVASTVVVALLGLLQYAGLVPFLFPRIEAYGQRVYSVFGNQDLYGGYLAIGMPLLVRRFLTRGRLHGVTLLGIAVLLAGLLISGSRAAWLATAVGVLVAMPRERVSRTGLVMLASACLGIVVLTVLVAPDATAHRLVRTFGPEDAGGRLRLWFWDGTLRMVGDAPVAGKGLGNYAYWSPQYLGDALHAPGGHAHAHNDVHTIHAHSDPLEVLAETGMLGALCWLWMLVRVLRRRGPEWGGLAALTVFALFNATLSSAPHALAGLLLAGMLLARHDARPTADNRVAAYGLAAASVALSGFFFGAVLLPSYRLQAAQDRHVAGRPCLAQYERVVGHPWPNARAREQYGVALAEAGRFDAARRQLERALDGRDTGSVYLALALVAQRQGDRAAARRWLDATLHRWPSNATLWEQLFLAGPDRRRARIRTRAARWGILVDAQGRVQGTTRGVNTPNTVTPTSTPAGASRAN